MQKKSMIHGKIFGFFLTLIIVGAMLLFAANYLDKIKISFCQKSLILFEQDLKDSVEKMYSRFDSVQEKRLMVPCDIDRIFFIDLDKDMEASFKSLYEFPFIEDSIKNSVRDNAFFIKDGKLVGSSYIGNIELKEPYFVCSDTSGGTLNLYMSGKGASAEIANTDCGNDCTFEVVELDEDTARDIIEHAKQLPSGGPEGDIETELGIFRETNKKVKIARRFNCGKKPGETVVEILIKGNAKNFKLIESIPKECVDYLNKYLKNMTGEYDSFDIIYDPLIVWHFNSISEETIVSYVLNLDLSEYCLDSFESIGLGVTPESKDEESKECEEWETMPCPKQDGVCSGSTQTCANNNWPGCSDADYLSYNSNYEAVETECDNMDNDCDGSIDEGELCNCNLNSAYWNTDSAVEGSSVSLTVEGSQGCNGKTVELEIWESNWLPVPDNHIATVYSTFAGTSATAVWTAEQRTDYMLPFNQYFFKASADEDDISSDDPDLEVIDGCAPSCASVCGGNPDGCGGTCPLNNGAGCDDDNACSYNDVCSGGTCSGTGYECIGGVCDATAVCDGLGGCTRTYSPAGTFCDTCKECDGSGNCVNAPDGTSCGTNEVCESGECETIVTGFTILTCKKQVECHRGFTGNFQPEHHCTQWNCEGRGWGHLTGGEGECDDDGDDCQDEFVCYMWKYWESECLENPACPSGYSQKARRSCDIPCEDECSPEGSVFECSADFRKVLMKTCGNFDADNCLEYDGDFADFQTCNTDEICQDGTCVAIPLELEAIATPTYKSGNYYYFDLIIRETHGLTVDFDYVYRRLFALGSESTVHEDWINSKCGGSSFSECNMQNRYFWVTIPDTYREKWHGYMNGQEVSTEFTISTNQYD